MSDTSNPSSPLYKSAIEEGRPVDDKRLFAPSAMRNKHVILEIFQKYAPLTGNILEIACGSGEHTAHFAASNPNLTWHPTDIDQSHMDSVNAHANADQLKNIQPAIHLDVTSDRWPLPDLDMIYNANMIHISPWECTLGLFQGASRHLRKDGILMMYGPYRRDGQHTSESNESFDQSLMSRDPSWGIRNLEDVIDVANENGLHLQEVVPMPANNFSVIYKKI